MFNLIRAFIYATLIVSLVLLFLPADTLSSLGVARPAAIHVPQVVGMAVGLGGAALALWCVITFAFIGGGTPLPFDPPRRLVVRGPCRFVRNPMAIGVALALTGAALYYQSVGLMAFYGVVHPRHPLVRGAVRGTHSTAHVRRRVRGVLASGSPLVAELGRRFN